MRNGIYHQFESCLINAKNIIRKLNIIIELLTLQKVNYFHLFSKSGRL
jgi:hypothetical protein